MSEHFIVKTKQEGVIRVGVRTFGDIRGKTNKLYDSDFFEKGKIPHWFCEEIDIYSKGNVLRGIHIQADSKQGKLLRVIRGRIYLVIVNLEIDSENIGQWEAFYLCNEDGGIYIPSGYGIASLTLEEDTIINIKYTEAFCEKYNMGIQWNDKELNIKWPIDIQKELIISEKDRKLLSFSEYIKKVKLL